MAGRVAILAGWAKPACWDAGGRGSIPGVTGLVGPRDRGFAERGLTESEARLLAGGVVDWLEQKGTT